MQKLKLICGVAAILGATSHVVADERPFQDVPTSEILAEIDYLRPMRGSTSLDRDTIARVVAEIALVNFCEGKSRDDASTEIANFRGTVMMIFGGSFPDRIMPNQWNNLTSDDCSSIEHGTGPVQRVFERAAMQSMVNAAIFARQHELQSRMVIETNESRRLRDIGQGFEQRLDAIGSD